jgi:hypothetical protein
VNGILKTIQRVRRELADTIPNTIRGAILAAYADAKTESGPGMKMRMIERICRHARQSADRLFDNIFIELTNGVVEFGLQFSHDLQELINIVNQQANRVIGNLGLGEIQHQTENTEQLIGKIADLLAELSAIVSNGSDAAMEPHDVETACNP